MNHLIKPLGRLINHLLRHLGYEVRPMADSVSWEGTLARVARRGLPMRTVIDVGASDGRWSALARRYFPDAHYLLVDANPVHEPRLRAFARRHPRTAYVIAVAGDAEGEVYFDTSHAFIGVAARSRRDEYHVALPMSTLDALVQAKGLAGPFLLKLDTHGFEVPIFNGAPAVLARTQLIVVEAYNYKVGPEALRFHELCSFLEDRGFRLLDLADPLHRPRDEALWQLDLFFVRFQPEDAPDRLARDVYGLFGMRREPGRNTPGYTPVDRVGDESVGDESAGA